MASEGKLGQYHNRMSNTKRNKKYLRKIEKKKLIIQARLKQLCFKL